MWHYDGHHFWGMHWFWWILWLIFIFWIFAIPYDIPGQRKKKETPLDILKKRYAAGEINKNEYEEMKKTLE
jgi:putative membrane protein|tara:strand:+ start:72099 stop:72311 length:213 start_codon:yes stop_codon:yes gene_type:complete